MTNDIGATSGRKLQDVHFLVWESGASVAFCSAPGEPHKLALSNQLSAITCPHCLCGVVVGRAQALADRQELLGASETAP